MNKKNTITLRLTDDQLAWLGALSRRSRRSKSEVIRSLIEQGRYENGLPVNTCTSSGS